MSFLVLPRRLFAPPNNFRRLHSSGFTIVLEVVDEIDESLLLFEYFLPVLRDFLLLIYVIQLKKFLLLEDLVVRLAQLAEVLFVLVVLSLVLLDHPLLKLLDLPDPDAIPHPDLAHFLFEELLLVVALLELSPKVIFYLLVHEEFLFQSAIDTLNLGSRRWVLKVLQMDQATSVLHKLFKTAAFGS